MFPELAEISQLLVPNANWMRIDVVFAAPATFEMSVQAHDAAHTGPLIQAFKKGGTLLKSQTPMMREVGGHFAALADGTTALADDMAHATATGSRVGFTAKGKSMAGVLLLTDLAMDPLVKSLHAKDKP